MTTLVTRDHTATRETQFAYFDEVLGHPDWRGRTILDFGGNWGIFLRRAEGVDHGDYWCLDVHEPMLERGRHEFPRAHFVHYDRFSAEYNPDGVPGLPVPDLGIRFDFILAFSVFTHHYPSEMLEQVAALRRMLAPGGALAFTFCDARYDCALTDPSLQPGSDVRKNLYRVQVHTPREIEELVARAELARWCIAVDGELYGEPGEELSRRERRGRPWESYCVYFTTETMQSLFPDATIHAPVAPEWQHCCVVRNG